MGKKRMTKREIKRRIRQLVAREVRERVSEAGAGYLANEPQELLDAWEETVWDIADYIFPEDKDDGK